MMEMIAMVAFLAAAAWLFVRFVLLYEGNFLNSLFRFSVCLILVIGLYNAILVFGFPDSEFAVRDVSRYGSGNYSISLSGYEKYDFVHADTLVIKARTDGENKTSVRMIRRTSIDSPTYAEAILLVPTAEDSKKCKRWLLEAMDDPFVGISYEEWKSAQ